MDILIADDGKINAFNLSIINDFLTALKLANKSSFTIYSYMQLLHRFFANNPKTVNALVTEDIQCWIYQESLSKKESTMHSEISILSSFFKFCQSEEILNKTLIKSCWYPHVPKSLPRYLEKNELAKVRICAERLPLRDRVIVEFLLSSGCRVSELCGLNIEDIDFPNRTAKVLGKGSKIRFVHFSETCGILLERYFQNHPGNNPALFLTRQGKRLSRRCVERIISKLGKTAGLKSHLFPHRLRHTFATTLLSKGADIEFISNELGHSNIGTTRIYARILKDELKASYRMYMG